MQNTHRQIPSIKTAPPSGEQVHLSRARWRDFSCRCQSYLVGKESTQNVHWKIRALRDFCGARGFTRAEGLRRRRRSFLSTEPKDPKEDRWEKADAKEKSDLEDRLVSKLLMEGVVWCRLELARLESSLLDPVFRESEREYPAGWDGRGFEGSNGVFIRARRISDVAAGSFSGGECFQRSIGVM